MKSEVNVVKSKSDPKQQDPKQSKSVQDVWDESLAEAGQKTAANEPKKSESKRKRSESDKKCDPKGMLDESDDGQKN